jgi:hypothetical protein
MPLNPDAAVHRVCATTTGVLTASTWHRYISALPYRQACD